MNNLVTLSTQTLTNLLSINSQAGYTLQIPDYQRIYCWEEKQVLHLLDDIQHHAHKTYHMGSIILHKKEEGQTSYAIVDGQQRLVTLSLLLQQLGIQDFALLNEKSESADAQQYIAYNKWLIGNYLKTQTKFRSKEDILGNLQFSVLELTSSSLDLAYTFFTSENGRGKPLTDYDLLKSHHLRYIPIAQQAEHVASRWDEMVLASNNADNTQALGRTFEMYLFRLRKWMRKRTWDDGKKRKVKTEFEAAPIIPDIPPFGEQFHFYETIQGGTHFFAYAEHFVCRYNEFKNTHVYKAFGNALEGEKHWWYRDVIEALLFAYYLKFGTIYINEAFVLIGRVISEHRYMNNRAYLQSLIAYAADSEIVMMIDQATSPTFFLAELKTVIRKLPPIPTDLGGTRARYYNGIQAIEEKLVMHHSVMLNNN